MTYRFAILAPVPHVHLESALQIAGTTPHVCFGSDSFDFFREVDRDASADVPIPFCATSHENPAELYWVKHVGWYAGSVDDTAQQRQ